MRAGQPILTTGLVALLAVVLAGCEAGAHAGAPRTPTAPRNGSPTSTTLRGFWVSEGYGYQFEILADDELVRSQITSVSCIPTWRARIIARDDSSLTYQRVDSPAVFVVRRDASPDRIRIHPTETASEIVVDRLDGALPVCQRTTPDTPGSNFDVFVATFAELYPFFAEHGVDWEAVVAAARRKVNPSTKPSELYDLMQGMLTPLQDAHVTLTAPTLDTPDDGRGYAGFRFGPGVIDPADWDRVRQITDRYLTGPVRTFCENQIAFGMLPDGIAYLRLHSFAGYTHDGSFESGLGVLDAALDVIFAEAQRWRGLVIDVRTNEGGADPYGLAVAVRLTASAYVAYAKEVWLGPKSPSRWTSGVPSVIKPTARPGYHGPVSLLIGPDTISAGETFTQALIERRPEVARVGQNTQGVFSDVMARRLPNGWTIGVPTERFVTRARSFDVIGIPPTIFVPVFAPSDVAAGRDAALEAALAHLRAG